MGALRNCGLVTLFVTFAVNITGLAAPYWIYVSAVGGSVYFGLWKICVHVDNVGTDCISVVSDTDAAGWFKAVQALSCVGFIFIAIASLIIVRSMCANDNVNSYELISSWLLFIAAPFILVAVAVFGTKMENVPSLSTPVTLDATNLNFAYYMSVISILGSIIAAILFRRNSARTGGYSTL